MCKGCYFPGVIITFKSEEDKRKFELIYASMLAAGSLSVLAVIILTLLWVMI